MTGLDILVVDDSVADRTSIKISFEKCGFPLKLRFAAHGRAAIDMLESAKGARPNVMLVDVKMPGMSGFDVLDAVKRNPKFAPIPVIMLSSSDDPRDVAAAYDRFAAGYICKPLETDELDEIARAIGELFTRFFKLPEPDP